MRGQDRCRGGRDRGRGCGETEADQVRRGRGSGLALGGQPGVRGADVARGHARQIIGPGSSPAEDETANRGSRGDEHPPEVSCCAPKLALSHEEEAVLKVMRGLTVEARALRAELKGLDPQAAASRRGELAGRLEQLRVLFREQKEELRLANEEKLRRLGHIP